MSLRNAPDNTASLMAKRRSYSAERFDLPLSNPEHLQIRDDAWIGGSHYEATYFLGWLQGYNAFDDGFDDLFEKLKAWVRKELPKSTWLLETGYLPDFFLIWVKAKYRASDDGRRFPFRKPRQPKNDKAVILLMDNPSLTDEQIRQMLNTTAKAMQRWTDYNLARIEMRRYQR